MAGRVKRDEDGKRVPLMVRTTTAMRSQLEAACAVSGRSLAQESELILEAYFAGQDQRTIIREEIRAAMGPPAARTGPITEEVYEAIRDNLKPGASVMAEQSPGEFLMILPRQAPAADERRLYGPRPELIGNDVRGYHNTLGAMSGTYGKTRSDLGAGMVQIHDRSALNGKQ